MRGGAQAHLIEGDDGNCYVVKFTNNLQHRRVLINEWVAAQLMAHIGIPTPPVALIQVSSEFLAANNDVYLQGKERIAVETGVHFGSRYPGHPDTTTVHDVLPDTFLARIRNRRDFVGALVFDRWVSNTDGPQAIFTAVVKEKNVALAETCFEALMIDRGFAFGGPDWILRDSPIAGIHPQKAFYDGLAGIQDCEPWLSRVEAVQDGFLREVFATVPPSWRDAGDSGLERLIEDLLKGRFRVADSIIVSAGSVDRPFRNWIKSTGRKSSDSARKVLGCKGDENGVRVSSATGN